MASETQQRFPLYYVEFYIRVTVHRKIIYIKRTNVMQLGSMFICNCNNAIDLGRLVGYLTLSHVTHQRLLLQFLSVPEDGRKKRPKHVEQYCSYK